MKKVFAMFFVMLLLQGCMTVPNAPFVPSGGGIVTAIKAPLTLDLNKEKLVKTYGEASTTHVAYYIFSFAIGDASLNKAIKDGLLKKAAYVDYEWASVFCMFGKLTVRAYGMEK